MSLLISGMDVTIVNLGLPEIQNDLHASITDLQWVIDAYSVGVASLLILAGTTGDRLGRKRIFQVGLVVFTAASVLCALAPSLAWLIAFRGVQAIGASMLNPLAMSIITSVFTEPTQRARAIGIWSGVFGVSLGLGPLVGGLLIGSVGWRAIFWVNVPIGLAATVLTAAFVPESRAARPRRVDPVGQLLVIALLGGLTFAIIEAPRTGWLSARADIAAFIALAAAVAFVPYELRRPQPLIELRLLRSARFSGAMLIAVMSAVAFAGMLLLTCLYLQEVRGRDPVAAGLYLLPMGVMTAVCAPISGRVIGRTGPRRPVLWSGAMLAAGGSLMNLSVVSNSDALLLFSVAAFAVGFGFVNAPLTYIAADELPGDQAGLAAAMTSTGRLVGGALGVAVIGSVLVARAPDSIADGFSAASAPCWWLIAGCGLAVLAIGVITTPPGRESLRRRAMAEVEPRPADANLATVVPHTSAAAWRSHIEPELIGTRDIDVDIGTRYRHLR
jgi:EmrB/QacA subfamily drug resistance transporter